MTKVNYVVGDSHNTEKIVGRFKRNKKISLILTSPPYFNVKNYENAPNQVGFGQKYEDYLDSLADIFQQCYRLSSTNASFWLVIDTTRKNGEIFTLPFDIKSRLATRYEKTWILKDIIIWNKNKNIPWHAKGKLKNQFEYILFFSKTDHYKYCINNLRGIASLKKWWLTYPERYNPAGQPPSNIWNFTTPIRGWGNGHQEHLCPFPFSLIERILLLSSKEGDLILDPFAGSGSVLAIAKSMKRQAIGIDINKAYQEKFENVLIGAEKHWATRKKELDTISSQKNEFKRINSQLRKIKCCLVFIKKNAFNLNNLIFLAIDKATDQSLNLNIVSILKSEKDLDKLSFEKTIADLRSEFKIGVNIHIRNKDYLKTLLKKTKYLYSYSLPKIYQYSEKVSASEFPTKLLKGKFYSNISLAIPKDKFALK